MEIWPPATAVSQRHSINGLGGFARNGREYVTVLGPGQSTPAPWINVIANPAFGFQTGTEGGGYTRSVGHRPDQGPNAVMIVTLRLRPRMVILGPPIRHRGEEGHVFSSRSAIPLSSTKSSPKAFHLRSAPCCSRLLIATDDTLLPRLHTSKPLHRPLSSSKRLMRILRPIVEAATDLLPICGTDLFHRRRIRAKPVGDDLPRWAVFLYDPLQKLQRRSLVPLRRDHRLQDLAFMVDRAPEVAELAVDLHEVFIQMPAPLRIAAHVCHSPLADLGGEHWAKPVPPKPDGLMADVDPALGQQILDVAQRQWVFARTSSRPDG